MVNSPLQRLLRPQSIAVFGGSWAQNVIEQCQKMGYTGKLWPVHPEKESVCGLPCFASIEDLPESPDASFIGVNRNASIEIVSALSAMNAGGAVCFASGFSEAMAEDANSAELEKSLVEAAGSMPILGPNCYGFINCVDKALLWPDQHGAEATSAGVAILTQSSNIAINLTMQTRGLPVAYVVTAGNQAQVTLAQLGMALLEDDRVTALGLHIEGFGDIREFEQLALYAAQKNKPVIALKVGKTDASQQALQSHTSSLAGSDTAANAFLARVGFARVHSLSVFIETLKLLHVCGGLDGRKLLSMSCSGGEACLMSDAAEHAQLECPPLNKAQLANLRSALGPRVALANPLDYHTYIWNDYQAMHDTFAAMLQSDANIALLVLDFPRADRCEYESWLVAIDAFKAAGKTAGEVWRGQLAVLASLPENMPEHIAASLMAEGVVGFSGLEDAMAAIAAAQRSTVKDYVAVALATNAELNANVAIDTVSEADAKAWLRTNDVSVPNGLTVNVAEGGSTAAQLLVEQCTSLSRPLVIKTTNSIHKSDSGGVVMGVLSDDQLQSATRKVGASGYCLVEEQVSDVMFELLVGVVRDPVHGFLMTIGAGGVQTEILSDTRSFLLPASSAEMETQIGLLNCFPLLCGYRGAPGCNLEQLIQTLQRIQQAALSISDELHELEINPLLCTPETIVAADALMRVSSNSALLESKHVTKH